MSAQLSATGFCALNIDQSLYSLPEMQGFIMCNVTNVTLTATGDALAK